MKSLPVNQLRDENSSKLCQPCGQAFKPFAICKQNTMFIITTMNTALASQLTHYASTCSLSLFTVTSTASQANTSSASFYSDTATSSSSGISISNTGSTGTTVSPESTTDSSQGGISSSCTTSTMSSPRTSVYSPPHITSSASSDSFPGTTTASSTTKVDTSSPPPPLPLISPSMSFTTSSQTFTTPPSAPLPQQQALASNPPSKAGPIAGSIIGFLLLVVIFLLWFYRKRIVSRIRGNHRVAPSAEFLDVTRTLSPRNGTFGATNGGNGETERFTSRRRGMSTSMSTHGGSRTASPLAVQRLGSSLSMHARDQAGVAGISVYPGLLTAAGDGVSPDEPPPPFTPGNLKFNDPLVEKLNDATRQREELYRATAPSVFNDSQQDLSTPVSDSGQSTALRMPVAMPIPAPSIVDTSVEDSASSMSHARQDSDMTRISHRKLVNIKAYGDSFFDGDAEEEMKNTSPMLNKDRVSYMSMSVDGDYDSLMGIKSHAGDTSSIGWAV